ncbi:hypothetical protein AJ80_02268 [Polytolypa hystricis UAMH7299]|uniref:Glutathione S-transferase n=1 Tax=Polytolypa hystricis (strain UAMH7299) TaxID=1447883 RepID=A0A2B7YS21_POLH7|nr:hypothetical protein AJ80_02268 [Polytolypa hystricis UAMH7299]
MSGFSFTVPENYGNVLAIALGAIPLLSFIHGSVTAGQRKPAQVPYPHTYATVEQCKANPAAERFNCAQRAHANFLENMPQTIGTMLVAGLRFPTATTLLGLGWVASRVLFMYGYVYSGKPNGAGRYIGSGFWLCQGALWALGLAVAWPMVKCAL